jgi:hypothetical protein
MKKLIALLFVSVCSFTYSQTAPQAINYQGLARNSAGNPITSQTISLRFEILQGSATGSVVYTETQNNISTGSLGLFNTQIGKNGNLATVNWQTGAYALRVGMDTLNGTSYINLGTQTLASVPYALYAGSSPAPTLGINGNSLTAGGNTITLPSQGGLQTLAVVPPNSVSISGASGNTIALPPINLTQQGATTITPDGSGYGYNINTPSVSIKEGAFISTPFPYNLPAGLLQVFGSFPNYSLAVSPAINYNPSTGILSFSNSPGTPSLTAPPGVSFTYAIVPSLSLSPTSLLSVGPSTNVVNLSGITPWRTQTSTPTTVTLTAASASVGIGTLANPPTAKLHVDGYTKLGDSAPAIKMAKLTGTTASALSGVTVISLGGINPTKILSISVMVDGNIAGTGEWIHPGYIASAGYEFNWRLIGTNIQVTNSATNSGSLFSKNIQILVTYEQ